MDKLEFRNVGIAKLKIPIAISKPNTPLSSTILLVYGFIGLILLGAILLIMPFSSSSGHFTSPINALFTATSAVCVTGLVVVDTGTYWSTFGQVVILILIQIGGFGFITGATILLAIISGGFQLKDKAVISDAVGLDQLGGLIGVVTKLSIFTLIIEIVGALLFYVCWLLDGNTITNFWTALFHSVSAFNNSGMDILGNFKSLMDYQGNSSVLFITAVLVIAGSTSYIVLADVVRNRRFIKLSLDTKIVLVTTLSLLIIGTLFYFIAEFSNQETLGQLSFPQKIMGAFFLSVTPRTAGFANVNIGALQQVSLLFTMFLMFIGGAAGSTAGGIKVNTFGVLVITVINVIKGKDSIEAFGRQITKQTVFRALVIPICYLLALFFIVILLSITETFPVDNILFETFSALSTVGLSTGITPDLSIMGRLIITLAMFIGRLGPLALMAFLVRRHQPTDVEYPHETIRFG